MGIGYRLIRTLDNAVITEWGGVYGEIPSIPNPLVLPNGEHVCGIKVGEALHGYRLEAWEVPPGKAQIKEEERKRVLEALGVDDVYELVMKQLEGFDNAAVEKVKEIRASAKKFNDSPNIPSDFRDEKHWVKKGEK